MMDTGEQPLVKAPPAASNLTGQLLETKDRRQSLVVMPSLFLPGP